MTRDFIRSAITKRLVPTLKPLGFVREAPKAFFRVRGDLIDGLTWQMSRWGSKRFYIHAWTIPRCGPPYSGYIVGNRHDDAGPDSSQWEGPTETDAEKAIDSVRAYFLETIEPWFQSMPDLSSFVTTFLATRSRRRKSAEYLAMMIVLGRLEEYRALLDEIDQRKEDQSQELSELRRAHDEGNAISLIDTWRAENLKLLSSRSTSFQRGGA